MKNPKITVVTSSYYRPDFLRRCIQSVQRQSFEDYEHIIVSDHDPFTKFVCDDFKDDSRIRFVEVENSYIYNLGAVSFNLGIELAKTDYICYALDDDILYENHLLEHYNYYKKNNRDAVLSRWHQNTFTKPKDVAKYILSQSFDDLCQGGEKTMHEDVLALSHTKAIGMQHKWVPQCELKDSRWEDGRFIKFIGGCNYGIEEITSLKIQWGGIGKKQTKGVDQEYYDILMEKLVDDVNELSGYAMVSDTPYVYPKLKDKLYG